MNRKIVIVMNFTTINREKGAEYTSCISQTFTNFPYTPATTEASTTANARQSVIMTQCKPMLGLYNTICFMCISSLAMHGHHYQQKMEYEPNLVQEIGNPVKSQIHDCSVTSRTH